MSTTLDRIKGISPFVAYKAPCRVATTVNITLSGEQTIDGVSVVDGDRVLVKSQTDTTENGVYVASTSAWARALDFNRDADIVEGTLVYVTQGTINAHLTFAIDTASPAIGSAMAFRTLVDLGLEIGTNVQAYDALLTAIAALTTANNKLPYFTGVDTLTLTDLTAFARTLLDDADAATARATLLLGLAALLDTSSDTDFGNNTSELADRGTIASFVANSIVRNTFGPTTLNTETAIDFSSIPATATEIEILFNAASLNGTDDILIQIGDSGGVEDTGYASSSALTNGGVTGSNSSTSGFLMRASGAGREASGVLSLRKEPGTNTWVISGVYDLTGGIVGYMGGVKTLSAALDRLRITRTGTDTYDGGQVSVTWRS